MSNIFINYRHEDSQDSARALYESLVPLFGKEQVFMDVERISLGVDFRDAIERSLSNCGVFLVIIGTRWLSISTPGDNPGQRRLDEPTDYVRTEIAAGLQKGQELPVIPVLVNGAKMPSAEALPEDLKSLAYRNALALSHQDWEMNVQKLVGAIVPFVGEPKGIKPEVNPTLDRLEDQIGWYDRRASTLQNRYRKIKLLEITSACAIPFFAAGELFPYPPTRLAIWVIIALIGILIGALETLAQVNQYEQTAVTYRAICEALKNEKYTFLATAGMYSSAVDARRLLAERVEAISRLQSIKSTAPLPKGAHAADDNDPILTRLEDLIEWYEERAASSQRSYTRIKTIELCSALAIPFLVAVYVAVLSRAAFPITRLSVWILIAFLGVFIASLEGILQLNAYQLVATTSRSACEALKHEKLSYLAHSGVYEIAANPHGLLAERIEAIGSPENSQWTSLQSASLQSPQQVAKAGKPEY